MCGGVCVVGVCVCVLCACLCGVSHWAEPMEVLLVLVMSLGLCDLGAETWLFWGRASSRWSLNVDLRGRRAHVRPSDQREEEKKHRFVKHQLCTHSI